MQLHIDFLEARYVESNYYDRFPLCVKYIKKDALYQNKWIHFIDDDYTNDAFVYIMPSETHDIPNGIWVSVLEVGIKNKGFGSEVLKALKNITIGLKKENICLHALDKKAKLFYISNGFRQLNDNNDMILKT